MRCRADVDHFDAVHDVAWARDPTESPPGHGPAFGPTADGDGSLTPAFKGAGRSVADVGPHQGRIDHVVEDPQVMFHGKINQPLGLLGCVDRTGRVVGRVEDDGFGVLRDMGFERIEVRVVVVAANGDVDGESAREANHAVVGRPSRRKEEHFVARRQDRHHAVKQGLFATRCDHHIVSLYVDVEPGQVLLNGLAQFNGSLRSRVGRFTPVQGRLRLVNDGLGCTKVRLTDRESDDFRSGWSQKSGKSDTNLTQYGVDFGHLSSLLAVAGWFVFPFKPRMGFQFEKCFGARTEIRTPVSGSAVPLIATLTSVQQVAEPRPIFHPIPRRLNSTNP